MGSTRWLDDTAALMRASRGQIIESSGESPDEPAVTTALARGVPGAVLTVIVLLAGATLTWLAFNGAKKAEEQAARNEIALYAADIQSVIQDRLLVYEGLLRAGAGVVNGFWPVSGEQWQRFVSELQLATVYPGIRSIGFIARLRTTDDLVRWRDLVGLYAPHNSLLWPEAVSGHVPETAVVFLEPLDDLTRPIIGRDLTDEPTRRLAMERARDHGVASLSGKVALALGHPLGSERWPGFLMFLPVYATLTTPTTLAERRDQLRGYVYSPFRSWDFFETALLATPPDAILEVYDGESEGADTLLFRSAVPPARPLVTDERTVTVAGQKWTLRVSSAQATLAEPARRALTLIAGAGTAVTLLLASIVGTLLLSRQRLHERIATERAAAQREQQAAQVLENALDQKQRQEAEIRQLNETLEQRVVERTEQLEVANRELSAANRDLEAFTYSVSHDLRAPLRAIDGHVLRFMEQEQPGTLDETQRYHADAVHRNIKRMNLLIDDLLNLAFIGRRPLEKERLLLWDLVRPILNELQSAKPVVYDVNVPALGEVYADPVLLRQVLMNLIANAVKFSNDADPPRVTIGSERNAKGCVYFVRDNGVGFDMRYADKLFGVFERLHNAKEFEGTGVGLAIVKQVIERHGGEVWAEAEVGRGATFYFTLGAPPVA